MSQYDFALLTHVLCSPAGLSGSTGSQTVVSPHAGCSPEEAVVPVAGEFCRVCQKFFAFNSEDQCHHVLQHRVGVSNTKAL